jgi:mono/diheme cytochrome c family protein
MVRIVSDARPEIQVAAPAPADRARRGRIRACDITRPGVGTRSLDGGARPTRPGAAPGPDGRRHYRCGLGLHSFHGTCMRRFQCVVLITLGLCATVASAQSPEIERGKKVYAAERCQVCHSIGGTGNKRGPLDGVGSKLTTEQIRQWLVNAAEMAAKTKSDRKPVMKSYPHLSKEDLDGVVAYLASLKK